MTAVSDLYSIGVMLYEALTGRVPFEADSAVAIAMKQVSQAPQRPSSINPQVSPALDAVVMRALEKEPGPALPERRRLHRRARRGAAATPAPGAAAPPPSRRCRRSSPSPEASRSPRERGGAAAGAAGSGSLVAARGADRPPGRLRPDPRHDDRGPRRDRQPARTCAIALLATERLQGRRVRRVEREAPANTVLEQDPLPRRRQSLARLRLPQLLLLEAEGDADGQRRPRQRQGALDRRA